MIITYKRRYKTVEELNSKGLISTTQQSSLNLYKGSNFKDLNRSLDLIVGRVQAVNKDNKIKDKKRAELVLENERLHMEEELLCQAK